MSTTLPKVKLLGSHVHLVDLPWALDQMEQWVREPAGRCHQIVVSGYHGVWESHKDPEIKRMLAAADLWVPDGIAPVLVARMQGHRAVRRVPGTELMHAFLQRASGAGYRSFFFGDTPETLAQLSSYVERKYPGHRTVGALSPPFRPLSPEEQTAHIDMINAARPDVLWVGLGLPKQERWIYERLDRLQVPVAVGVGAAFGFVSGKIKRAPGWVGDGGLEWAYRLLKEPRKCWRRSVVEGPQFLTCLALEMLGLRHFPDADELRPSRSVSGRD